MAIFCHGLIHPTHFLQKPPLWRIQATTISREAPQGEFGYGGKSAKETRIMVTGSTGYIGRFVVKELVNRGYNVLAVARERSGTGGNWETRSIADKELAGADLCLADVTDEKSLRESLFRHLSQSNSQDSSGGEEKPIPGNRKIDVVVCCLASRTGGVSDSWKIDYTSSRNSLNVGIDLGARHFILLSAICVQKPLLEFQRAKLRLECEIQELPPHISWSIVRPTAFFKSLGGQVEIVKSGGPFVVFGDGNLCSCKPISESDLAKFISDCISDTSKHRKVLPVGGPGKAYSPLEQGNLLFGILGKSPRFIKVPIEIMDWSIALLDWLAKIFPGLEDPAEYAKIGRYYAAESMLVLDTVTGKYDADGTPSYGKDTLEEFFRRVVKEGMAGQELGEQAVFLNQKT